MIDQILMCPLVQDVLFLLPFFHCNHTIKDQKVLEPEVSKAESCGSGARNTAFHLVMNCYSLFMLSVYMGPPGVQPMYFQDSWSFLLRNDVHHIPSDIAWLA